MNSSIDNIIEVDHVKPLLDSFLHSFEEAKKYDLGIGTINHFVNSLKGFYLDLSRSTQIGKEILLDKHYHSLLRLKFQLKASKDTKLISFHDKIFKNELDLDKKFPTVLTILFESLIRGITYFQYQIDSSKPMPIYHRLYACGVGDKEHREANLICFKTFPKTEINRRKLIVERCYLEYKVIKALYDRAFDALFLKVQTDFQTCFKNHDFKIIIDYDGSMPYRVHITRLVKDKVMYEEIFEKTIIVDSFGVKRYDELVECTKIIGAKVFKKVQSFAYKVVQAS